MSLAYKYVSIALMLAEANTAAGKLRLRAQLPMEQSELRRVYVGPPRLMRFLGSIDTEDYSFGFAQSGRLRFITKLHAFGDEALPQLQKRLAKVEANMSTNTAIELATNWLAALSVDLKTLETQNPRTARQHFFYGRGQERILLPLFDVLWGDPAKPAVIVTIYGPTGELLQLRQNDESFSRRPARALPNVESLLAIPDADFSTCTPAQRASLLPGDSQVEAGKQPDALKSSADTSAVKSAGTEASPNK
jgi:hypothetical protein